MEGLARKILSPQLDRQLVSFQANKKSPIYRLFKYKEGFSATLVSYFIDTLNLHEGPILDPFSGTGTTSLVASSKGIDSTGIELLPIGNLIAEAREEIGKGLHPDTIERIFLVEKQTLEKWGKSSPVKYLKK